MSISNEKEINTRSLKVTYLWDLSRYKAELSGYHKLVHDELIAPLTLQI